MVIFLFRYWPSDQQHTLGEGKCGDLDSNSWLYI